METNGPRPVPVLTNHMSFAGGTQSSVKNPAALGLTSTGAPIAFSNKPVESAPPGTRVM